MCVCVCVRVRVCVRVCVYVYQELGGWLSPQTLPPPETTPMTVAAAADDGGGVDAVNDGGGRGAWKARTQRKYALLHDDRHRARFSALLSHARHQLHR